MESHSPDTNVQIRNATSDDLEALLDVEKLAFGRDEEANLIVDLLDDPSAQPLLSLIAEMEGKIIGHILFTRVHFENSTHEPMMHLLAPMAVLPGFRSLGIGGMLIKIGLERLKSTGTELVFVLGHEEYYPKFGFIRDAGARSYIAPFPIPEKHANAWMVQPLASGVLEKYQGKIRCADSLNKKEYWEE